MDLESHRLPNMKTYPNIIILIENTSPKERKYSRFTQIYAMASKSLLTLAIDRQFSNPLKP
jgi:hypothetical protein